MKIYSKATAYIVLFTLASITVSSCSKKPNDPPFTSFQYPLKTGTRWEYSGSNLMVNFQPDSLEAQYQDNIDEHSTVEIIKDTTLMDSIEATIFEEIFIQFPADTFRTASYFRNTPDGFYYYGSSLNKKMIPLKTNPRMPYYRFNGRAFNSVSAISSFLTGSIAGISLHGDYDSPRKSLQYPLKVGQQWSTNEPPRKIRIDKVVVDTVTIEANSAQHLCMKVQWLMDTDKDGEWDSNLIYHDYISESGLIKRSILIKDIQLVTCENPSEAIGTFDSENVLTLSGYSSK